MDFMDPFRAFLSYRNGLIWFDVSTTRSEFFKIDNERKHSKKERSAKKCM
jgi:hypothetical protein